MFIESIAVSPLQIVETIVYQLQEEKLQSVIRSQCEGYNAKRQFFHLVIAVWTLYFLDVNR